MDVDELPDIDEQLDDLLDVDPRDDILRDARVLLPQLLVTQVAHDQIVGRSIPETLQFTELFGSEHGVGC